MKRYTQRTPRGMVTGCVYDLADMQEAWAAPTGQGKLEAKGRSTKCIIIPTTQEAFAAKYARTFCEDYFNIPTCTYWDGQELILYYGDAGHGAAALRNSFVAYLVHQGVHYFTTPLEII